MWINTFIFYPIFLNGFILFYFEEDFYSVYIKHMQIDIYQSEQLDTSL